jgi:ABC-type phosphate transport system substrate-binding protein
MWGLAGLTLAPRAASQGAAGYQVIVNTKNSLGEARREVLADIFLKRATRWDTSESAAPVDLRPDSPARKAFSKGVLGRSVAAVRSYWTQRIFSGRDVPPPELPSEEAVGKFVATHPGAVGYIGPGPLPPGTKRLEIR